MATEVSVTDHPVLHEELKEEIHVKEVISKPTEDFKDSSTGEVDKPIAEDSTCVTEVEEVKKVDQVETSPTQDKQTKLPPVESEEPNTVEEMAQDNETKSPAKVEKTEVEEQAKVGDLPTEVAQVAESEEKKDVIEEVEKKNIETYPVEKSTEEIEDNKVEVPGEELRSSETRDFVPETGEKENEPIGVELSTPEPEAAAEPDVAEKKQDEQTVTDAAIIAEKKESEPTIYTPSVPADEIALMKEEKPIVVDEAAEKTIEAKEIPEEKTIVTEQIDKEVEPIKIEEAVENVKQEEKPTVETNETATEATETDKPALEPVKTESETKEEEKTTPKSNNLFGKVKKSLIKAKKAITGKNNTNTNAPKTPEAKEDKKP